MNRTPVKSSQLESIGYDAATETLEIEFKARPAAGDKKASPGGVYQYAKFPKEAWQAFQGAASAGSHFYKLIKGKYAYTKVS